VHRVAFATTTDAPKAAFEAVAMRRSGEPLRARLIATEYSVNRLQELKTRAQMLHKCCIPDAAAKLTCIDAIPAKIS
jgi:hypothetical protein